MTSLKGQRAFITGGASGIGAEMARRFTREGAHVVVADVNDGLGKLIAVEVGGDSSPHTTPSTSCV